MTEITLKTYLSYHRDDYDEVEAFLQEFDYLNNLAIERELESLDEDIVKGADKHKVIHKVRERYLKDSTVTLLLIGKCTYARRSIDLELLASLHHGGDPMATAEEADLLPNGLLGVMLKSYGGEGFPDRLDANLQVREGRTEPYAQVIPYPESKEELAEALEAAQRARTEKRHLIDNTPHMFSEDRACL